MHVLETTAIICLSNAALLVVLEYAQKLLVRLAKNGRLSRLMAGVVLNFCLTAFAIFAMLVLNAWLGIVLGRAS